jgi:lipid-binding SYLF domain-containing protein
MKNYHIKPVILLITFVFCILSFHHVHAQEDANPQQIVEQAAKSVSAFAAAQEMQGFRDNLKNARAILIIPRSVKAGFIIGVSGGYGAMMARNSAGGWNGPAFYNAGGGSVGLQAGAKVSEIIMLVMNDQALEKMLEAKIKFGGGVSVAIGVGAGAGTDVKADVLAYSRSAGAFGGVSLEGGIVEPLTATNAGYYGQELSAGDILIDAKAGGDKAADLRSALDAAAGN